MLGCARRRRTGRGLPPRGVPLDEAEVRDFYRGFSNEIIWPLFHDLPSLCSFDPDVLAHLLRREPQVRARGRGARGAPAISSGCTITI